MSKGFEQLPYKWARKRLGLFHLERRLMGHYDQSLQNEKGCGLRQAFYSQNPAVLELGSTPGIIET